MASLNKIQLIGRLGKDPEARSMASGTTVANFSLATDESYVDKSGTKHEAVEWHRIQVWDKLAENCVKYLNKGSQVYVEGKIVTRKWQDPQGQERYSTEVRANAVMFLDSKPKGDGQGQQQQQAQDSSPAFPTDSTGMDGVPF